MIAADVLHIPLEHAFSGINTPYACRSRIQVNTSSHGHFQSLIGHGLISD
jgi:alpha-ribazole phosphatase